MAPKGRGAPEHCNAQLAMQARESTLDVPRPAGWLRNKPQPHNSHAITSTVSGEGCQGLGGALRRQSVLWVYMLFMLERPADGALPNHIMKCQFEKLWRLDSAALLD
eukprot:scaffold82080_cov66-Phaeocystis_antarctica.AAC.1